MTGIQFFPQGTRAGIEPVTLEMRERATVAEW